METVKNKTQFLDGFGSENLIEEFYLSKNQKLRPGTVLSENEDQYKIEVGVPFMRKNDMNIELMNDKLIITGNRPLEHSSRSKERNYKGIFHLPNDIKKDEINVSFNDGLLTVKFPKNKFKEQHQSTRIKHSF